MRKPKRRLRHNPGQTYLTEQESILLAKLTLHHIEELDRGHHDYTQDHRRSDRWLPLLRKLDDTVWNWDKVTRKRRRK